MENFLAISHTFDHGERPLPDLLDLHSTVHAVGALSSVGVPWPDANCTKQAGCADVIGGMLTAGLFQHEVCFSSQECLALPDSLQPGKPCCGVFDKWRKGDFPDPSLLACACLS